MRIWLRSSQLWVESLKLWNFCDFFSGDLRGPIGDLCLSWRPSLFVSRGVRMQSQAFKMFHFFQERELSSYDGYTRGRWDWNCEIREFFSLQMFAWVQEQLCCTTEQHWLSALVRTVFQNMCQCSILTRFICHTLRYLPNTDTPMCDPWAAVQFNKHQCKFLE